ncbi:hypothetical protein HMI56_006429 [Coelomomyces lativittatus]|nr:hypothetical protein HMI56_006429 [Coelomomyces lativittatus]
MLCKFIVFLLMFLISSFLALPKGSPVVTLLSEIEAVKPLHPPLRPKLSVNSLSSDASLEPHSSAMNNEEGEPSESTSNLSQGMCLLLLFSLSLSFFLLF